MKRLSHTSGEPEIAAAIVGKVSISCRDACDVFDQGASKYLQVKHGFCRWTLVFVHLRATLVFTELQYLQPALIYCLLRKFLFGGVIFFSSRGEPGESWLSLFKQSSPPWWSEPDRAWGSTPILYLWTDSMIGLSRRDDFEPRWFQHFVYEDGVLSPPFWSPPHPPHLRRSIVKCRGPMGAVNQDAEGGDVSHGGVRTLPAAFRLSSSRLP